MKKNTHGSNRRGGFIAAACAGKLTTAENVNWKELTTSKRLSHITHTTR
jgi:hypothetical protein